MKINALKYCYSVVYLKLSIICLCNTNDKLFRKRSKMKKKLKFNCQFFFFISKKPYNLASNKYAMRLIKI